MKRILFYKSKSTDPAFNLAMEEFLLRHRREGYVFLVWQNAPSVIIGRNQVAASEVDLVFARGHKIPVFRRMTGGGAVYHDLGNVNFTFIRDYDPERPPRLSDLIAPIADFLRQMNLPAMSGTRNDLFVCKHKVCGTAFAIDKCRNQTEGSFSFPEEPLRKDLSLPNDTDSGTAFHDPEKDPPVILQSFPDEADTPPGANPCRPRILVHGCLLFNVDLDILSRILTPSPEKLARNGIPSVRSRVANLIDFLPDETIESFQNKLIDSVLSEKIPEKLRMTLREVRNVSSLAETYKNLA